jgi:hypothetical protein
MFKPGDNVRCIESAEGLIKTHIYTVEYHDAVGVKLKGIFGRWFHHRFELINDFQVGDKVRFKTGQDLWTVIHQTVGGSYKITLGDFHIFVDSEILELVEKAVQFKDRDFWVNVYADGPGSVFKSEEEATKEADPTRVHKLQKITLKVPNK